MSYASLIKMLGKEHYIEEDPLATHSGIERFWAFELPDGQVLGFLYEDEFEMLYVGSNKESAIPPTNQVFEYFDLSLEKSIGIMWD